MFVKTIIGLFSMLLIIIIRCFIDIRIGLLRSDRIGHYILETQLAILQKSQTKVNKKNRYKLDIWFENNSICNTFIRDYWRSELNVLSNFIMAPTYSIMKFLRIPNKFYISALNGDRDIMDQLHYQETPILFSSNKVEKNRHILEEIGLPPNARFICFHNRDSLYLKKNFPDHDYSDHQYRDTTLSNYIPGLEALTMRGYYILRMGKVVAGNMPPHINSNIIDYAQSSIRSDEMDIFAISQCEYFISNSSGIDAAATFLKKPVLYINNSSIGYISTWNENAYYSNKRFLDLSDHHELSLEEIKGRYAHEALSLEELKRKGIYLEENSPEENCLYMLEFDDYFQGKDPNDLKKNNMNQKIFWEKFPFNRKLHPQNVVRCRISNLYLNNTNILGTTDLKECR